MAEQTTELQKAKEAYPKASKPEKKLLETIFGAESFSTPHKVQKFEDAWPVFKKMNFTDELYKKLQSRKIADMTSIDRLLIISRVIQGVNVPDYNDSNKKKFFAVFQWNKNKAGFGFSRTGYVYGDAITYCGSRLCFLSEKDAEYFGTQFIDEHNKFLTSK